VISERDILGTQLVRRNDELALLYEKIKIQQSTLNKGEIQYNQRLEDIRVLKLINDPLYILPGTLSLPKISYISHTLIEDVICTS
jgi:hypothetical protein